MGRSNKENMQVNGLIDRGCSLEGKLMFDGMVQINGDFRGEIFSDGTLVIGTEANVDARIQVDTVIIEGCVRGTVEAKGKVDLRRGSRLLADIQTPALIVEDGALFHGQCQMMTETAQEEDVTQEIIHEAEGVAAEGEDSLMM